MMERSRMRNWLLIPAYVRHIIGVSNFSDRSLDLDCSKIFCFGKEARRGAYRTKISYAAIHDNSLFEQSSSSWKWI